MPVTMQDIARDLKVSVVTVSKVLRNQGNISTATRNRVLQRARELNYQTNWAARSLVTRRTYTIGLLLPDFTHPFFADVAKAVAEFVRPRGYHVLISYFEEDPVFEKNEIEALVGRQIDGLIVASSQSPENNALFDQLVRRKLPLVLIDRVMPGIRASFVGVDNEKIGEVATDHLISGGYQRIAHLQGGDSIIAKQRFNGYRRALANHGRRTLRSYILDARHGESTGYDAMKQLLTVTPMPDAVFCYNDPVAVGAMRAIMEAGLRIPDDIAVVGAGNVRYSDILAVPLTTVDQSTTALGTQAATLLLQQIESDVAIKPVKVSIDPQLIVRKSSGAILTSNQSVEKPGKSDGQRFKVRKSQTSYRGEGPVDSRTTRVGSTVISEG